MLRAIFGFDHIAKNVSDTWLPNCGYVFSKTASGTNRGVIITPDGSLAATPSTGNTPYVQVFHDLSKHLVAPVSTFTIGIRAKQLALGNSGGFLYLAAEAVPTSFMLLLNFQQLTNIGVVGGENYIEITFDLIAATATYYIDDVFFTSISINTISLANLRAGIVQVVYTLSYPANVAGITAVRDIYLTDNYPGDGYVGRLGPRKIFPVTLDSASGTDWTTSDGSGLLTALNVPIETAGAATMTSGVSKAPLVVGLNPGSLPANANVDGVFVMMAGKVDQAGALTGLSATNGGKTILAQSKAIGTAFKYGNPFGVFTRAPNGSRWTAASIDATTLSLTPDVAS
jgi:hypothetical protein